MSTGRVHHTTHQAATAPAGVVHDLAAEAARRPPPLPPNVRVEQRSRTAPMGG
ncbi:hypothetical protein [Streptomyces sp. NPDC092370]|uniref:hypothetical protein n=1 Tax=Streptomyces sp. NPDC092370 TaxID=3366016 RepID=UPI0037F19CF1